MQRVLFKYLKKMGNLLRSNWILAIAIGFFLWMKVPTWRDQSSLQGQQVGPYIIEALNGAPVTTDSLKLPRVMIFWATWCGPCKVEMTRYQKAIQDGDLDPSHVYAISFDEDPKLIEASINENQYTFNFLADRRGDLSRSLKVRATPTVVHVDSQNQIQWMSAGISLMGVSQAIKLIGPVPKSQIGP